ncbi:MAG: hypothetical protein C0417_12025 [Chlorobiaceae bacterium]|nr:hypothetical protein [Chlorobiaceae bacterium]
MKSILLYLNLILITSATIIFNGCELFTKPNGSTDVIRQYGDDLIISEVFSVPPDRYYAYSWIEIMNPTGRAINWVEKSWPATGFMVGDNGTILNTTDNGIIWQSIPSGVIRNFNAVNFSEINYGIIVGDSGKIIKITGNGDVFTTQDISDTNKIATEQKNLNDVEIGWNNTFGYAIGDSGLILATLNRGLTWSKYQTTRVPYNLRDVSLENFTLAWVVGDSGTILKSTRARSWDRKNPPDKFPKTNFKSCTFIRDTGWVVGENGAIAFTKTGGNIFAEQFPPEDLQNANFNYVFFGHGLNDDAINKTMFNLQEGYIVGDGGVILRTTNYGQDWLQIPSPTTENLYYIYFTDSLTGWIVGANGTLLVTGWGGSFWYPMKIGNTNLYSGHFNPAMVTVTTKYGLEIKAKRKEYYFDPATDLTNYNVFVKIDTGYLYFDPESLGINLKPIVPGGFCVINNDSVRFGNHTKVGPGPLTQINASISYYFDPTSSDTLRRVLWDLLSTGEIRLVKYETEYYDPPGYEDDSFKRFDKKIIDVVRWGNYNIPDSAFYASGLQQVWPQKREFLQVPFPGADPMFSNLSVGMIPDGYSIARYANDYGTAVVNNINSANSFYMAEIPLPGWVSQRLKK